MKTKIKNILFCVSLTLSFGIMSCYANGGTIVPAKPSHHGDFYIGAGISGDFVKVDKTANTTIFTTLRTLMPTLNADMNADGVDGNLFAGYGIDWGRYFYTAVEIFGTVSDAKGSFSESRGFFMANSVLDNDFKFKNAYGISFIPGINLNKWVMLYARVGYIRGEFSFNQQFTSQPNLPINYPTINQNYSKNGLQLGLGLQGNIGHSLSLRAQYTWNRFPTQAFNAHATFGPGSRIKSISEQVTIKNTIQEVSLSLIYHFHQSNIA